MACERCRKKKIRCTSHASAARGPCHACHFAGVSCIDIGQKQASSDHPSHSNQDAHPGLPPQGPSSTSSASPPAPTVAAAGAVAPSSASGLPPSGVTELPPRPEMRRLLDAYFTGPHNFCFYAFVHQPNVDQMLDNNLVPRSLLLILAATSLHWLEPRNSISDQWADECSRRLMREILAPPSTTTLQTLLLLQRYEWHRANHIGAWFLSGLAIRLAHGLQVNIEIVDKGTVPVIVRETRRRLAWCCLVMESMIEAGRSPLSRVDVSSFEIKLPCDERSFRLGLETNMPDLNDLMEAQASSQRYENQGTPSSWPATAGNRTTTRDVPQLATSFKSPLTPLNACQGAGISAFLVRLTVLRRAILEYTFPYHPRNHPKVPKEEPWRDNSNFSYYEKQLSEWWEALPPDLHFTQDVLYRRRPHLVSFITLHCLFHGCYCDLYRIGSYINASSRAKVASATDPLHSSHCQYFLTNCRQGRMQHALAICSVISDSMKHYDGVHDPVVAIGASLAIRVLIIERQPDDNDALGISNEVVLDKVNAAVQCAREVSKRSKPICELFCSVCSLARSRGYVVDVSDLEDTESSTTRSSSRLQNHSRAQSPSLRTYGTFGKIQSSLDKRGDVLAPAASTAADKESDLFSNYTPVTMSNLPPNVGPSEYPGADKDTALVSAPVPSSTASVPLGVPAGPVEGHAETEAVPEARQVLPPAQQESLWNFGTTHNYLHYDSFSPSDMEIAPGWHDGTFNFSMMPSQSTWIDQSLDYDFGFQDGI